MHVEQELVLLIPPNSLEWMITLAYFTANIFTHYLNLNRDLKTPIVVANSHSALWLSRFNIPIPLKRRKSNYPETRNSWPIIPYLNRDGGEAVGLLEEHGASRLIRVHLVLEYGIRLHPG